MNGFLPGQFYDSLIFISYRLLKSTPIICICYGHIVILSLLFLLWRCLFENWHIFIGNREILKYYKKAFAGYIDKGGGDYCKSGFNSPPPYESIFITLLHRFTLGDRACFLCALRLHKRGRRGGRCTFTQRPITFFQWQRRSTSFFRQDVLGIYFLDKDFYEVLQFTSTTAVVERL